MNTIEEERSALINLMVLIEAVLLFQKTKKPDDHIPTQLRVNNKSPIQQELYYIRTATVDLAVFAAKHLGKTITEIKKLALKIVNKNDKKAGFLIIRREIEQFALVKI